MPFPLDEGCLRHRPVPSTRYLNFVSLRFLLLLLSLLFSKTRWVQIPLSVLTHLVQVVIEGDVWALRERGLTALGTRPICVVICCISPQ
ncbi:hypothetical protein B0H63DRAFT_480705 [Podospora didyma]|uniref:Uncharacterized protein n=1 Tax=Podospora didyma TaxID=330526 RepID=A0AAE0KEX3_9PEZI|nr:hypothetical protein B0H63DRAFT_480705 [Podospora didyma]